MNRIEFALLGAIGVCIFALGYGLGQRAQPVPPPVAVMPQIQPASPEPVATAPMIVSALPIPALPVQAATIAAEPVIDEAPAKPEYVPPPREWGRLPDGTWIKHQRDVSALQSVGG